MVPQIHSTISFARLTACWPSWLQGKTVQAIALASCYQAGGTGLLACGGHPLPAGRLPSACLSCSQPNPPPNPTLQDEWPLLIVVPASLRLVWAEELEKWLPHLRPTCIHVIEGKEDRVGAGALPLITITRCELGLAV